MATHREFRVVESHGCRALLLHILCMLGHWRVDSRGPFLIRLRLNRVSHSSMKGTLLVLDILRAFIRVTHQLVVSAVVRLSPRALLPAVGVEHRPFFIDDLSPSHRNDDRSSQLALKVSVSRTS